MGLPPRLPQVLYGDVVDSAVDLVDRAVQDGQVRQRALREANG
ncbi:hypothetical protein [Streptomyces sp. DvalAA-14]|nr:hypothetical protein [Streptomyces sp. DvalAA-14]